MCARACRRSRPSSRAQGAADPSFPAEKATNVNAIILEIRAAEGGDDAKLLVVEQYRVYQKLMGLEGL